MKKKFRVIFLVSIVFFISLCGNVNAETQYFTGKKSEHLRKNDYLSGITEEMCTAEYWKDKNFIDIDQILMNSYEIDSLNKDIVDGSGTMVFDLTTMQEEYDADSRKQSLSNTEIPTRELYINGVKIDNQKYFSNLKQQILKTGYTGTQKIGYGICTDRADLKSWPTDDQIGYSATDKDDEMQSSAMNINEPFVIRAKCEVNGKTFYWGNSTNCTGWTNAENVAICDTKDEWINYWKVDTNADNFVTVTGSRIILENSSLEETEAMLGSVFKIVPLEEIPDDIKDKVNTNYIVYFAGNNEGKAEKRIAVLDKNLELSQGYLPLTQNNVLNVAFSCIGDEYGWGGMNGNMDCSLYTRSIYKCFGLELPRNTTWQQKVPGKYMDVSNMNIEDKKNYLSTLPAGSLFYISGHTMVYVGLDKDKNFVVSDLGTVVDEEGEIKIKDVYAVTVNSLNVRRSDGSTWLENITGAISFMNPINISECEVKIEDTKNVYDGTEKKPKVEVTYQGKAIYENANYNVEYTNNVEVGTATVEITGINNFTGTLIKNFEIEKEEVQKPDDENKGEDDNKEENDKTDNEEKQPENSNNKEDKDSTKDENSENDNKEPTKDENNKKDNQESTKSTNESEQSVAKKESKKSNTQKSKSNNKKDNNSEEKVVKLDYQEIEPKNNSKKPKEENVQEDTNTKQDVPEQVEANLSQDELPHTGFNIIPFVVIDIVAILALILIYKLICKIEKKKK